MDNNRHFLHFFDKEDYKELVPASDQEKNKPFPLLEKPYNSDKPLIDLISPNDFKIGKSPFFSIHCKRVIGDCWSHLRQHSQPL